MPADGVKGKTWGPSTLHQRERSHLPLPHAARARPHQKFSKSAPDLPPPATHHYPGTTLILQPVEEPRPKRKQRKSKSQGRPPKNELSKKRTGSHDDLLNDNAEPRKNRFPMCFRSTADLPNQYDTVFDMEKSPKDRKGSHGEVKSSNFFRSIRSNSLAGLLAVAGSLTSETTELLRDSDEWLTL